MARLLGLSLVACNWAGRGGSSTYATPQPAATVDDPFAALSVLPLKLPRLAPGQPCLKAEIRQLDGAPSRSALGNGPVYVLGGQNVFNAGHPTKVAWAADPAYTGPIRVRGGQIDGSGQLLLGGPDNHWHGTPVETVEGTDLYPELDFLESHTIANPPSPWRIWPSKTYIATPGCYAWQVDGLGFTELITIQA